MADGAEEEEVDSAGVPRYTSVPLDGDAVVAPVADADSESDGRYTSVFSNYDRIHIDDDSEPARPRRAPAAKAVSSPAAASSASWNEEFQLIMELDESDERAVQLKYQRLAQLLTDFLDVVSGLSRLIVQEIGLDAKSRTVPAADFGGRLGGTKFRVRGLVFKLAEDKPNGDEWIYGGRAGPNDELASKGARHDLRGAIAYHNAFETTSSSGGQTTPRVPFQALVSYRGHTLIAMPELPVSDETLVYGSSDGGVSILNQDFEGCMERSAAFLHLAPHLVGGHLLHAAGDVELHRGKDGRHYLLDLSRAMPPEHRGEAKHLGRYAARGNVEFYRLLRPELLRRLQERRGEPVSPDGMSGWSWKSADFEKQAESVRAATHFLIHQVIPEFVRRTLAAADDGDDKQEAMRFGEVALALHRAGINVRHVGLVRMLMLSEEETEEKWLRAQADVLLAEMRARALKNLLRKRLRERAAHTGAFGLRAEMADFLAWACADEGPADVAVLDAMRARFGHDTLADVTVDSLHATTRAFLPQIADYLLTATGFQLSAAARGEMRTQNKVPRLSPADFESGSPLIKTMPVAMYATGRYLAAAAATVGDDNKELRERLRRVALKSFQEALETDPLSHEAALQRDIVLAAIYDDAGAFAAADALLLPHVEGGEATARAALVGLWGRRRGRNLLLIFGGAANLASLEAVPDDEALAERAACFAAAGIAEEKTARSSIGAEEVVSRALACCRDADAVRAISALQELFEGHDRLLDRCLVEVVTHNRRCPAEVVEALVHLGADANVRVDGCTPLHVACSSSTGHDEPDSDALSLEMIHTLIVCGADPNLRSTAEELAPLHVLARAGKEHHARVLLEEGAADAACETLRHDTPLIFAAARGHTAFVRLLLEHEGGRASVNARADGGWSALLMAVDGNFGEIVDLLLANGADPRLVDVRGRDAVMSAAKRGYVQFLERFLAMGLPTTTQSRMGDTALMLAVRELRYECVELLKDRAGRELLNNAGQNADAVALEHGDERVREILGIAAAAARLTSREEPVPQKCCALM